MRRCAARLSSLLVASSSFACADPVDRDPPWSMTTAMSTNADSTDTEDDDTSEPSTGYATTTEASTSSDDPSVATGPDETGDDTTTGAACDVPDPAPAWQLEHLQDVVAGLSGESPIDGVTLTDRASVQRRALVATWLLEQYGVLGIAAEPHDYGTGTNVIATIPATTTSQGTLVLGAHYDTVSQSPGANDNATGIAVITAAARYIASIPCRSHDVLVVAFDEEEIGLVGSAAYAAKLVSDRAPVVSVHTIDQIGWDSDGDRFVELERPDPGLFEFYDDVLVDVPAVGGLLVTDTGFTDHVSFRAVGFLATGISEEYVSGDTTPHYHLPSDTYDTVDFAFVSAASTLVNRAFARAIAVP